MSIPISDIQNFINDSFLSEHDKQLLRATLEKEGASESFFELLDNKCAEQLEKQLEIDEALAREVDAKSDAIEEEYLEKMKKLDAALEEHVDESDKYYEHVRETQLSYMRRLKDIYTEAVARLKPH